MYTWKTTHSYLHLTKIQVCKTVNYHPNEYSARHISEPRCRKLKPSQGRGQWDSCQEQRACTASQCSFLPILQENWYWEGHAWEAEMCSRPGQTESVLSTTGSVFASRMVQFHVVQSRPVPWPILLHYPLAKGVEPVTSIIKCAYRSEIKWQQME